MIQCQGSAGLEPEPALYQQAIPAGAVLSEQQDPFARRARPFFHVSQFRSRHQDQDPSSSSTDTGDAGY